MAVTDRLPSGTGTDPATSPAHWAMHTANPADPWHPYRWHRLLNRKLMDLAEAHTQLRATGHTDLKRFLILSIPVRHGKSVLATQAFIGWWLGTFSYSSVIFGTYNATFAKSWSRKIRNTLREFGPEVFGVQIASDSAAVDKWSLAPPHSGMLTAVGAGTAPTGVGGHLIVLDDPTKSIEEALSEVWQERIMEWFMFDIRPRLQADGVMVLIQSRWGEKDLSGQIQAAAAQMAGDLPFEHLWLPALAEPTDDVPDPLGRAVNEPLCPEMWSLERLLELRDSPAPLGVGARVFDALYQNRPLPTEGGLFREADWRYVDVPPAGMTLLRAWDLAATEKSAKKTDPDWTAGVLMGRSGDGRIYIVDARRTRLESADVQRYVRQTAIEDFDRWQTRRVFVPQDPGQAGKPVYDGTMILMGDGSRRRLDQIAVGDAVITHKGRLRRVTAVHVQGDLPTVTITTHAGRTVIAALDHPFLTPDGFVDAGNLQEGDVLGLVSQPAIMAASDRSPEEFRLAGYFVGDGNTSRGPTMSRSISCHAAICCPHDLEQQADIQHCAKELGFDVYLRNNKDWYFRARTASIQQWLRDTGLAGHNAFTKRVPAWVFTAPTELIAGFLGAYFACDGYVAPAKYEAEFYSVNRDLLADVQHLLLRIGVNSTLQAKNGRYLETRHQSWRLRLRQNDDGLWRFATRVPIYHSVKGARLRQAGRHRSRFDEQLLPDQIVSVAPSGIQPCRCLIVADDHTFTTEDIVVHNSQSADYAKFVLPEFAVDSEPVSGDKVTRAMPYASQQRSNNVVLVRGAWNKDFVAEHAAFNRGTHDDQVDAAASCYERLIGLTQTLVRVH